MVYVKIPSGLRGSLFGVVLFLAGCSTASQYYIRNAQLAGTLPEREETRLDRNGEARGQSVRRLLSGHYIEGGTGLVLAIRRFDPGDVFTVDDEHFEKLTIQVEPSALGTLLPLDSPGVRLYYSAGNSPFARRGRGLYGSSGRGTILIERYGDKKLRLTVDIAISVKPTASGGTLREPVVRKRQEYVLSEIPIDLLTPWIGIPGASVDEEVYP